MEMNNGFCHVSVIGSWKLKRKNESRQFSDSPAMKSFGAREAALRRR